MSLQLQYIADKVDKRSNQTDLALQVMEAQATVTKIEESLRRAREALELARWKMERYNKWRADVTERVAATLELID